MAKKYKLGTMSKVFKVYGPDLTCPETNTKYFKVDNLKVMHDYGKKMTEISTKSSVKHGGW